MIPAWLKTLQEEPVLRSLADTLRSARGAVYLVGGVLRDAALKRARPVVDVDLAVAGTASTSAKGLARRIARRVGGSCFVLHEATQVYRIVPRAGASGAGDIGYQIDVAQIQGRDIAEDLARRDFTVNAMAAPLPIGSGELLDPFNGLADLRRRLLRATSERVLKEDPLRLLRAFRLAAQLGLRLEGRTLDWIRTHRRRLKASAPERIRAELMDLLSVPESAPWIRKLDDAGLLTVIFDELEKSRPCAEVYYGKGGVLKHSIAAVERLDFLLAELERVYPGLAEPLSATLDAALGGRERHKALLRLAALLHDVAKPPCARRIDGRLRFFGHEARGAEMVAAILRRLRFTREEIDWLSTIVAHHLRPGNLAANKIITDKAVFRFFRDLGPRGPDLLLLCWADHASYLSQPSLRAVLKHVTADPHTFRHSCVRSPETRKTLYHLQTISLLMDRYFHRPETVRPKRLVDGRDVMRALNISAGPRVGEVLRSIQEAQAEGSIKSRRDALLFLASHY
ncbi:MAG: HD domain-containing protein [Elusimicrobiota bacterium]